MGSTFYRLLSQWLSRPNAHLQVAALVFCISLPAIAMGLVGDDYDIAVAVADDPFGAYQFTSTNPGQRARHAEIASRLGVRPWWTADDHHVAFFRPLASLSHALDFRLFSDAPWLMHVENSLLFACIVLLAAALYRQLGVAPLPLGLATFFYAFSGQQSMTVGWISGRNTLLAAALGWLAVLLHIRASRQPGPLYRVLATAALAAALLSAEGGIAALAYIVAHVLILEEGPVPQRVLSLWPYALLVIAWRAVYTLGGYGVAGSAFYLDPVSEPWAVALNTLGAIPIYLASHLTFPFASMSGIRPGSFTRVLVMSLVLLAALRPLVWPLLREDRTARFLGLGALLSIVPLGATLPQDRLGFFVGFGTSALIAQLVHARLAPQPQPQPQPGSQRGARILLGLHAAVLPLLFVPMLFGSMNQFLGGGAAALDEALPTRTDTHVVLLNGPSHLPVHFQRLMRAHRGEPGIPVVDMLYAGGGDTELHRVAESSFEMHVPRGWFATPIEGTARNVASAPFHTGQRIDRPRLQITILEVNDRGAPVRVRFDLPPSRPKRVYFAWTSRQPQPFTLPAIGESVTLPGISPI